MDNPRIVPSPKATLEELCRALKIPVLLLENGIEGLLEKLEELFLGEEMNKHLQYLKYMWRHKWFVIKSGWELGVPLPLLLFHDISKFLPCEWFPYLNYFYGTPDQLSFDRAWLHHIHRNKHHWQYWVLRVDSGEVKCLDMPLYYILEMVADWIGAGKTKGVADPDEVQKWYEANKQQIQLSPYTRHMVELIITFYVMPPEKNELR